MINSGRGSSPPSVLEKMEGRRRMRQKWKKRCLREREASYTCKERGRLEKEKQENMQKRNTKTERVGKVEIDMLN